MESSLSVNGLLLKVYGKDRTEEILTEMANILQDGISKHQKLMQEKVAGKFKTQNVSQSLSILAYRFSLMVEEHMLELPFIEHVEFKEENIDRVLEISLNNQVRHYVINRFRNKVFYTIFVNYMQLRNPEITERINLKQMYAHVVFSEDVPSKDIETNYKQLAASIQHYEGFLSAVFDASEDTLLF